MIWKWYHSMGLPLTYSCWGRRKLKAKWLIDIFSMLHFKENLLKRWLCSTLVFAHTVIVFVYILSLFIFNKTVKKKFMLRFSNKSVQASSCERPRNAERTLFLSFEINNCFQIAVSLCRYLETIMISNDRNQCRPHTVKGLEMLSEPCFCHLKSIIVSK